MNECIPTCKDPNCISRIKKEYDQENCLSLESENDYQFAMSEIERLWNIKTPEAEMELDRISLLAWDYEKEHFPIEKPVRRTGFIRRLKTKRRYYDRRGQMESPELAYKEQIKERKIEDKNQIEFIHDYAKRRAQYRIKEQEHAEATSIRSKADEILIPLSKNIDRASREARVLLGIQKNSYEKWGPINQYDNTLNFLSGSIPEIEMSKNEPADYPCETALRHIIETCAPDLNGKYDYERQCWDVEQLARRALNPNHEMIPYPGSTNNNALEKENQRLKEFSKETIEFFAEAVGYNKDSHFGDILGKIDDLVEENKLLHMAMHQLQKFNDAADPYQMMLQMENLPLKGKDWLKGALHVLKEWKEKYE